MAALPPRSDAPSQTDSLRRLQLGHSLSPSLAFRAQAALLSHLHRAPAPNIALTPAAANAPIAGHAHRNPHIVAIAPSPDRALVAVASSLGIIEIHEPSATDDTLRLKLGPHDPTQRLVSVILAALPDDVVLSTTRNSAIHLHDLNKCHPNRPCRIFPIDNHPVPVYDVVTLSPHTFAATCPRRLAVFDTRVRGSSQVTGIPHECPEPLIAASQHALLLAAVNDVRVFDFRKFPTFSPTPSNSRSLCMGSASQSPSRSSLVHTIAVSKSDPAARFNSIVPLPDATDGLFFYHLSDGTLGTLDVLHTRTTPLTSPSPASPPMIPKSRQPSSVPTTSRDRLAAEASRGLCQYGTAANHSLASAPWFVPRRRIDVLPAPQSCGWRVLLPDTTRNGVSVAAFGPRLPLATTRLPVAKNEIVTVATAIDSELTSIWLGTANNRVSAYTVDTARTWKKYNDGRGGAAHAP